MPSQETLYPDSISIRKLPVNFDQANLRLFEHELKKAIPATTLLHLKDVKVNSDGILFRGSKILPESFPAPLPKFTDAWAGPGTRLKFWVKNYLLKSHEMIDRDVFWITDIWSTGYFHWMTDVLPRLFTIREEIGNATLLLPAVFQRQRYIAPSLKPFTIQEVKFVHEICRCENFKMPTHTAPSGNYNESIIGSLKDLYTDFYQNARSDHTHNKVYISRSKAQNKKIVNEGECIAILKEFGFKTVCFEDYSFQEQVNIALHAQYLISNHGAGLTNMFFMKPGSSVFELRQKEDAKHNCFFALASTVNLKYYYQLCDSENPGEDAHTASLIVDCQLFRKNIEQMLADGFKQSM